MNIQSWGKIGLLATVVALMFSSCDSAIYDYEGDCSVNYQVKFRYDMNMKFADAFPHAVKSVKLFAFDQSGTLVAMEEETDANQLSKLDEFGNPGYFMPLNVKPGTYDLLAWAGLGNQESFELLGNPTIGSTKKADIQVKMKDANGVVDKDLNPLFHGMTTSVTLPDEPGWHTTIVPLVKNTNNFRIVLQQLSGEDVDINKFELTLTDENGWMAYDNSLVILDSGLTGEGMLTYKPWHTSTGMAGIDYSESIEVAAGIFELTTGRLMTNHRPILSLYNKEKGEKVFSIPVIDYALLVKGYYNQAMSDQEYLDRQDEYNMTFFLEGDKWASASVIINSWRVVINHSTIE